MKACSRKSQVDCVERCDTILQFELKKSTDKVKKIYISKIEHKMLDPSTKSKLSDEMDRVTLSRIHSGLSSVVRLA